MKRIFLLLFAGLIAASTYAEELSYEIDSVATADAPWKAGEKVWEEWCYVEGNCYTVFLGVTDQGNAVLQIFYDTGAKYSDPYLLSSLDAVEQSASQHVASGVIVGVLKDYYRSGKQSSEVNFANGMPQDTMLTWYENGQKHTEFLMKNGEIVRWVEWDEQGNLVMDEYF